jgi:ADP-heptose:LPS heptosyltransferase
MPGSLWDSKAWPHYPAITRLARAAGFKVVVLGAPSEAALCAEAAGADGLDLCGRTSLKEAAAWLRGAAAALGNDSGLSHLAAAVSTPVVVLYGPTDPTGPVVWGPRVTVLRRTDVPCAPCYLRGCKVAGHPCLAGLGPETVWAGLRALIG